MCHCSSLNNWSFAIPYNHDIIRAMGGLCGGFSKGTTIEVIKRDTRSVDNGLGIAPTG